MTNYVYKTRSIFEKRILPTNGIYVMINEPMIIDYTFTHL